MLGELKRLEVHLAQLLRMQSTAGLCPNVVTPSRTQSREWRKSLSLLNKEVLTQRQEEKLKIEVTKNLRIEVARQDTRMNKKRDWNLCATITRSTIKIKELPRLSKALDPTLNPSTTKLPRLMLIIQMKILRVMKTWSLSEPL
jgi:hypothetical protein